MSPPPKGRPRTDRAAGAPQRPAWAMVRGGLPPAVIAGLLVAGVVVILDTQAGLAALLGVLIALPTVGVVPLLMWASHTWSPPLVLAAALGTYGAVVTVLWLVSSLLNPHPWGAPGGLAAGFAATCLAWALGVARAMLRLRQHPWDTGADQGPAAGPRARL